MHLILYKKSFLLFFLLLIIYNIQDDIMGVTKHNKIDSFSHFRLLKTRNAQAKLPKRDKCGNDL